MPTYSKPDTLGRIIADLAVARRSTGMAVAAGGALVAEIEAFTATAGANTTYTLAFVPVLDSEFVYVNSLQLRQTTDYTRTGAVLTLLDTLTTADMVDVHYWRSGDAVPAALVTVAGATFTDDFNRADSATTLGAPWEIAVRNDDTIDAVWGISGNKAYCVSDPSPGGALNEAGAVYNAGTADFDMQFTVSDMNATGFEAPIAMWRVKDVGSADDLMSYFVLIKSGAAIWVAPNTGGTQIISTGAWSNGDVVRVVCSGTSHTIYRNGVQVGTFTHTGNQTTGLHHGMASYGTDFETTKFDDFSIIAGA